MTINTNTHLKVVFELLTLFVVDELFQYYYSLINAYFINTMNHFLQINLITKLTPTIF